RQSGQRRALWRVQQVRGARPRVSRRRPARPGALRLPRVGDDDSGVALMFRVTREIHFCYGHRLLQYEGKCRHLHGHNGRAVIVLEGTGLDDRGMLVDFGDIKRKVQHWIDENIDHTMLPVLREHGERVFVMDANPTAENIARLIFDHAVATGLPVVEVVVWETE